MTVTKDVDICERALSYIPRGIAEKIRGTLSRREDYPLGLSEIRLRVDRGSSLVLSGENIPCGRGLTEEEADRLLTELCHGSVYAFRDSLRDGYIACDGIRVGIVAEAKYEGGELVGICRPEAFVFRLPVCRSAVAGELADLFMETSFTATGMLIFSPPSGGKTTALRGIAARLGSPEYNMRVVVIDEKCEFVREDYRGSSVDILRGFRKAKGIEVALRGLSPQILIIDEIIGESEAQSLLSVGRGGVRLIASAHGGSIEEMAAKGWVQRLVRENIIDSFAQIRKCGSEFSLALFGAKDIL